MRAEIVDSDLVGRYVAIERCKDAGRWDILFSIACDEDLAAEVRAEVAVALSPSADRAMLATAARTLCASSDAMLRYRGLMMCAHFELLSHGWDRLSRLFEQAREVHAALRRA